MGGIDIHTERTDCMNGIRRPDNFGTIIEK